MRSTFKVLFYVNGSKEKNGIVPIMGRVTINGSVAQFSCKLTITKTMWDAMERAIITISENGRANIPSNVWMSEMELVELFGVIAQTLQSAIRAIYKSGTLCPVSTQRCDLATAKVGLHSTILKWPLLLRFD